jgi:hypothetical protein
MLGFDIVADTANQLCGGQQAAGFDDRSLTVDPMRFEPIEPGAFDWQTAGEEAYPALPLHPLMVAPQPTAHLTTDGPGGIVPDHDQDLLALPRQSFTQPGQQGCGDMAHRPALDKAPPHIVAVSPPQPITAPGVGLRLPLGADPFDQPQGVLRSPAVQSWVGQPTPPSLIGKTQHPVSMLGGQAAQPITRLFLKAYGGSGLVIQRLARRQCTPKRLSAWRMVSRLTWCGVRPCSRQTSAAQRRVQVVWGLPKARGRSCRSVRH